MPVCLCTGVIMSSCHFWNELLLLDITIVHVHFYFSLIRPLLRPSLARIVTLKNKSVEGDGEAAAVGEVAWVAYTSWVHNLVTRQDTPVLQCFTECIDRVFRPSVCHIKRWAGWVGGWVIVTPRDWTA